MLVVDKNTFKTEVLENEGYVLVDFFGSNLADSVSYFDQFNLIEITDNIITKTNA